MPPRRDIGLRGLNGFPALPSCGKSGANRATPAFGSRGSGVQIPQLNPEPQVRTMIIDRVGTAKIV
jgi:hypothetical protein